MIYFVNVLFLYQNEKSFKVRRYHRVEFFFDENKQIVKVNETGSLMVHGPEIFVELDDLIFREIEDFLDLLYFSCRILRHVFIFDYEVCQ